MNATQKNPHPRELRYLHYVTARLENLSQDEIARGLEFNSPAALDRRLRGDGYPVCPECRETPVSGEHCPPPRKRAPAKGAGGGSWRYRRVAPGLGAVELFEEALEQFRADITHLARRREYLQGERFAVREEWVTGFEVPRGKTPVMRRYLREGTDADSWRI